jgi:hypothetical protein
VIETKMSQIVSFGDIIPKTEYQKKLRALPTQNLASSSFIDGENFSSTYKIAPYTCGLLVVAKVV